MKTALKSLCVGTALAITSFSFSVMTQAETIAPKAVEQVNLERYTGQWHEIAHLPMYFQRKCVANTKAQYTLNSDQTMTVLNSCVTKDGKTMSSEGVAYIQNEGKSKLKVSFLPKGLRWIPFTKGHYWVLRLDPDYKVVLVGGPTNEYLWILSRDTQLDDETYQSYLNTAKQYGYDVNQLIKTPHQP